MVATNTTPTIHLERIRDPPVSAYAVASVVRLMFFSVYALANTPIGMDDLSSPTIQASGLVCNGVPVFADCDSYRIAL